MPAEFGFLWPYAALLLPLPWLLRRLLAPARTTAGTLWLPVLTDYQVAAGARRDPRRWWPLVVATLAWCLLVAAATRPVWVNTVHDVALSGRNVWVAIDLSQSMRQTDFHYHGKRVARLQAARQTARDFVAGRRGDRVGLLVFGTRAYIHAPLTLDRNTVQTFISQSHIGMAGGRTAIGDAIGLAVKRTKSNDAGDQILVLLSDGASTTGEIGPSAAARLAAKRGLKVYTIGLGGTDYADQRGIRQLRRIASITGGEFAIASSGEALQRIFERIDRMEPVPRTETVSVYSELFIWPLAAALLVLLFGLVSPPLRDAARP